MMRKKLRQLNRGFLDAIHMRNKDGIRHFLEVGANIDAREEEHDQAAIILAAKFGDAEIVEFLINKGAKVDARDDEGRTALFFAEVGSKVFASLVAAGADINAKDNEGNSILMRMGIEPDVRNEAGESALDLAVSLGLVNVIERLKSLPAG
jgi:ankyrin repeat protein